MDMSKEETIFGDDWPYSKAKSALLRSAAVVIRERGPRSATLKNVAGKAGVTEPAIFRHFDGVDGVFMSLHTVSELFYNHFIGCFKNGAGVGFDRLESAFDSIFGTLKEYPDFAYIIARPDPVFRQYPKLKEKVAETDALLNGGILACLKEAKTAGQLVTGVDPDALTTVFAGALFQVMSAWLDDVEGVDPRKEGKKVFGTLCALARLPGTETKVAKPKATKKKQ